MPLDLAYILQLTYVENLGLGGKKYGTNEVDTIKRYGEVIRGVF